MSTAPELGDVITIAIVLLCIAVAAVTWRFVEEPARQWSRRKALGSKRGTVLGTPAAEGVGI